MVPSVVAAFGNGSLTTDDNKVAPAVVVVVCLVFVSNGFEKIFLFSEIKLQGLSLFNAKK